MTWVLVDENFVIKWRMVEGWAHYLLSFEPCTTGPRDFSVDTQKKKKEKKGENIMN